LVRDSEPCAEIVPELDWRRFGKAEEGVTTVATEIAAGCAAGLGDEAVLWVKMPSNRPQGQSDCLDKVRCH